jgi:hypothetical protein
VASRIELGQGQLDATSLDREMRFAQNPHRDPRAPVRFQGTGGNVVDTEEVFGQLLVALCPADGRIDTALV